MSNEIIPINTRKDGKQTVNARDLHEFLEVGKDFTTWIKDRINSYNFEENQDFTLLPEIGEQTRNTGRGGHNKTEYHITIDMAKELSMVERNEKGKQARQYFIKMENIAKSKTLAMPNFSNPAEAARAWALEYEEKQKALAMVERKDVAIQEIILTKAHINSKQTATAMNTASQKVKENEKLKEQIGDSTKMKIDNIARSLDCSDGEVIELLEGYHLLESKDTGKKTVEGNHIVTISITEIGQFFCDYEQNPDFYETEWHVDKLWKLSDFQEYQEYQEYCTEA